MLFDKKDYNESIKIIRIISCIITILIIVFITIAGYYLINKTLKGAFVGFAISLIISFIFTTISEIKTQEMFWRIDIYEMLKKKLEE